MEIYKNQKRIIITGPPASGKTYLSKKMQEKLNIPKKGLDEIYWDKKFSIKADKVKMIKKLKLFLKKNKSWILEGVYFGNWTKLAYERADLVIFLDISKYRITNRLIFKRYLKSIKKLFSIAGWIRLKKIVKNVDLIRDKINHKLSEDVIKKKTIIFRNIREIDQFLESIDPKKL